jgi:predicted N-acetyltransferase YhbS
MTLFFDPARLTAAAPYAFAFPPAPVRIDDQRDDDSYARESLLDEAFGPARFAKTCQRLRDGRLPAVALAAHVAGELIGTLRMWHVDAGGVDALLLGPLAVANCQRALGVGAQLMREALWRAAIDGRKAVILVGDAPYYARFGFDGALTRRLDLPGPVDRARFLGFEIADGALRDARGMVRATGARDAAMKIAA